MAMPLPPLQHDCNACSALCCVVFPFDKDQGFGFDKEALTPCTHLKVDFTCGIHRELESNGFKGCIHYSCHGAGQRVTRVFGEVNWRSHPDKADEIYGMFSRMNRLHGLLALLQVAIDKVGEGEWRRKLEAQQQLVEHSCRLLEKQSSMEVETVTAETHTLLRQLATEPAIVALRSSRS